MKISILTILISCALMGCNKPDKSKELPSDNIAEVQPTTTEYATGFTVTYRDGYKWVEVPTPYQGATDGFKYVLVQRGQELPDVGNDIQIVEIPIKRIVCNSTTHIPLLDYLNETESLVGFPSTDYVSSQKMRARIDAGHVTELGRDSKMNIETLMELDPEMVMAYSLTGDYAQFRKLQQAGIPVIINAEYLEPHPLGRAEWIKFMALFFNKEKMADSVFNEIKNKYLALKKKGSSVNSRPTIFSGIVYGDIWYMPGGKNHAAQLFDDAGGKYLWSEDESTGFLEYSFEAVYDKASKADYWVGVASYHSLAELKDADPRYTRFEAYKKGDVYSYNARMSSTGGNEYLELGYLRPDLILEDLLKIFHPELMENDELFFHQRVE